MERQGFKVERQGFKVERPRFKVERQGFKGERQAAPYYNRCIEKSVVRPLQCCSARVFYLPSVL